MNITKINTNKAGYLFSENEEISGEYHGVKFCGKVSYKRRHTINHDQTEITLELNEKIVVYGTERETISLSIKDNGQTI